MSVNGTDTSGPRGREPHANDLWQWAIAQPDQNLVTITLALDCGPSGLVGADRKFSILMFTDTGLAIGECNGPSPPHPLARLVPRGIACGTTGCSLAKGHKPPCHVPLPTLPRPVDDAP